MEPSSPLQPRLSLLDDFEMCFDGEPLTMSGPAERLVAYLAVVHRHRPARRAALAERLWSDAPAARAASSLRSVLWRLPRPRGRTLVIGNAATVGLHEDVQVDLWQGEQLADRLCGDEPPANDALTDLALIRADLLPHWHEDWLEVEREAYRQKRLHALERSAAALCDQGRYTDALSAGLGAVQSEPLRESAHRRVIQVHLAEGNHSEALRHYDGFRRLLAHELGLPPSPRIRSMVAPLLGRPVDSALSGTRA